MFARIFNKQKRHDPVNEQRKKIIIDRYFQWSSKKYGINLEQKLSINKNQLQRAAYMYPIIGLLSGIAVSYAFTCRSSKYIRKLVPIIGGITGGWLAHIQHNHYQRIKLIELYDQYPKEIQKMIDNDNSSYAHRWLRENYLNN